MVNHFLGTHLIPIPSCEVPGERKPDFSFRAFNQSSFVGSVSPLLFGVP